MSTVIHAETITKNMMNGFPQHEISFLLGSNVEQRVARLKFTLRNDPSSGGGASVMTHFEETLIYQEPKTLTSRFSNFLSSKLGIRAGE
jgi:hypothetical protein